MRVAPLVLLALATACGRTVLDSDDASGDSVGDAGFETGADGGPLSLCEPDGIRICGASCPELATPDSGDIAADAAGYCPGVGCLSSEDIQSDAAAAAGVCWADMKSIAQFPCGACNDGEVCLEQATTGLVCVPEDVCRALWDLGVRDVCRYADFHPYDGRPLPTPTSSCPPAPAGFEVCGATCDACDQGERCVGRSPDHPFGICRDEFSATGTAPTDFKRCWDTLGHLAPTSGYGCAAFATSVGDESLAKEWAVILRTADCLAIAPTFPGGLRCYDPSGQLLNP